MKKAFDVFDMDRDGLISLKDLTNIMRTLDENRT
jgi:Ca2+-binding EF-hand superfamily protein